MHEINKKVASLVVVQDEKKKSDNKSWVVFGHGICSQSVFGVSAESMQCSYDRKGNSVPTILLLMQERLYHQGGLKVGGFSPSSRNFLHKDGCQGLLSVLVVDDDVQLESCRIAAFLVPTVHLVMA